MRLALYQPEIPQNTGTLLRTAACLTVDVDIIEPCGFVFSDKHLKRAGMDYLDLAKVERLNDWAAFQELRQNQEGRRLVLLTTKGAVPYTDFQFQENDVLLLGNEGSGVPEAVHNTVDARIIVPMSPDARSLNVAVAASMVLGEALRQTKTFPKI
ncbi:MAG: tRNA methyltransferase [Rhodospirillaceae bacterium]|nr:MAG: tRNA methyltransferase [Rhodospirillaceae bacterium]